MDPGGEGFTASCGELRRTALANERLSLLVFRLHSNTHSPLGALLAPPCAYEIQSIRPPRLVGRAGPRRFGVARLASLRLDSFGPAPGGFRARQVSPACEEHDFQACVKEELANS